MNLAPSFYRYALLMFEAKLLIYPLRYTILPYRLIWGMSKLAPLGQNYENKYIHSWKIFIQNKYRKVLGLLSKAGTITFDKLYTKREKLLSSTLPLRLDVVLYYVITYFSREEPPSNTVWDRVSVSFSYRPVWY